MKIQFAEYISISIIDNNIFLFDERINSIYCIAGKDEKKICAKLIDDFCLGNASNDFVFTKSMEEAVRKLITKGFVIREEESV